MQNTHFPIVLKVASLNADILSMRNLYLAKKWDDLPYFMIRMYFTPHTFPAPSRTRAILLTVSHPYPTRLALTNA